MVVLLGDQGLGPHQLLFENSKSLDPIELLERGDLGIQGRGCFQRQLEVAEPFEADKAGPRTMDHSEFVTQKLVHSGRASRGQDA